MKVALRKWWEDKVAIGTLLMGVILQVVAIIFSTQTIQKLPVAVTSGLQNIYENVLILACLFLGEAVFSAIGEYSRGFGEYHLFTKLIDEYIDKELDGDYNLFLKFSTAKVITISDNLWKITAIGRLFYQVTRRVIEIVVVIYMIWYTSPEVIIPILVIYIIGGVILKYVFRAYHKIDKAVSKTRITRATQIEESVNGFAEVRSFVQQHRYRKEMRGVNHETNKLFSRRKFMDTIADSVIQLLYGGGTVIAVIISVNAISRGYITIAEALAIVMYIQKLINPLVWITESVQELSELTSMMTDYQDFMEYENVVKDEGIMELKDFHDKIEIRDLTFSYDNSDNVLSNISMTIPKGSKIGICGESGGGKSTLFNLLQKFYAPSSGAILIDGINYQDIKTDSLRCQIGMVHQDTFILDGTFRDNIRFGKWNVSDYEIIEACKKANIYDFIQKKPEGFDTNVGPRGLKLSGGQKQRIALARLFLVNPDIILLDEATSALDNTSETIVQEVIDSFKDKTIITIAHRLTTIQNSDKIFVLKNSKIVEEGTHEELLNRKGEYEKLFSKSKK